MFCKLKPHENKPEQRLPGLNVFLEINVTLFDGTYSNGLGFQ